MSAPHTPRTSCPREDPTGISPGATSQAPSLGVSRNPLLWVPTAAPVLQPPRLPSTVGCPHSGCSEELGCSHGQGTPSWGQEGPRENPTQRAPTTTTTSPPPTPPPPSSGTLPTAPSRPHTDASCCPISAGPAGGSVPSPTASSSSSMTKFANSSCAGTLGVRGYRGRRAGQRSG